MPRADVEGSALDDGGVVEEEDRAWVRVRVRARVGLG